MGKTAVNGRADAAALADKAARKAMKKARKAELKAQEKLAKVAAIDAKNPIPGKKERQLEKQLLEIEKKRFQNLAESTKLEAEAKQLLQQSEDAGKLAKRVAKALKKATEGGKSQPLSNLIHDDDADSSDDKDVNTVMEDTVDTPKATSKLEANGTQEAAEKENNGDEKKKDKKKKKSKSKPEESNAVEEQATSAKVKADGKTKAEGKRKRQDDNAEQPVRKKEKKAKGGEQVAQATTTEKAKIQGLEGGAARQDKFLRLLGGKKAGVSTAKPGSIASNQGNSVRAEAAIQQQFETGMMLKESGHKRRGLGA